MFDYFKKRVNYEGGGGILTDIDYYLNHIIYTKANYTT